MAKALSEANKLLRNHDPYANRMQAASILLRRARYATIDGDEAAAAHYQRRADEMLYGDGVARHAVRTKSTGNG